MHVLSPDQETAVELLIAQATTDVGSASAGPVVRALRRWVTWLQSGRERTLMGRAEVGTRWQDDSSYERPGWYARGAYVAGSSEPVFEIDYEVCQRCGIGWVEQPYTLPAFQRRGLASAGLASLRRDHPEAVAWHTLGGHLRDSRRLWDTAGAGVLGGYRQRGLCQHVQP
jgi:hypothetical protein